MTGWEGASVLASPAPSKIMLKFVSFFCVCSTFFNFAKLH